MCFALIPPSRSFNKYLLHTYYVLMLDVRCAKDPSHRQGAPRLSTIVIKHAKGSHEWMDACRKEHGEL